MPNAIQRTLCPRANVSRAPTSCFRHELREPPAAQRHAPRQEVSEPFASRGTAPPSSSVKRRKREIEGHLRVYRVRMIPTTEQARELKRCFSAARHAYNAAVAAVNGGDRANFYERRAAYKLVAKPAWAQGVSSSIVDGAVEQAVNAYKSNYAKMRVNAQHTHFHVGFRSHKKASTEVLRIEGDGELKQKHSPLLKLSETPYASANRAECLAHFGCNLKAVGGIRLQDKEHVVRKMLAEGRRLKETCKIQWDKRVKAFYFLYTHEIPRLEDPDPEFETKRVVATDPGVRRFQTFYSPTSGDVGTLLYKQRTELETRCKAIDDHTSWLVTRAQRYSSPEERARRTRRQRQRTFGAKKRALAKERVRLHEWMRAAHYDAANFLLKRYDVVIAPKLATAEMVPRDGRVFGSKTARAMLTWSHGLFAQRLESAAVRYPGRCVIADSGEPGTSKTCTRCGFWNASLGASQTYECPRCNVLTDRDVAGARNNFLAAYGQAVDKGWDGQTW